MSTTEKHIHFGDFVYWARIRKGLTVQQMAAAAGVSAPTIIGYEKSAEPTMYDSNRGKLAAALGMELTEFDDAWSSTPVRARMRTSKLVAEPPPAIDETRLQTVHEIPTWDIDVAAGRWVSVPIAQLDYDDPEQRAVINAGRFRLRIVGDCMEPDYRSGSLVEFEIVRVDCEGTSLGADYVVCRNDGTATFKRLVKCDAEGYELAAVNQAKHPGSFVVPLQEVVRVARAVYVLAEIQARPIKLRTAKR